MVAQKPHSWKVAPQNPNLSKDALSSRTNSCLRGANKNPQTAEQTYLEQTGEGGRVG